MLLDAFSILLALVTGEKCVVVLSIDFDSWTAQYEMITSFWHLAFTSLMAGQVVQEVSMQLQRSGD